jgi:putative OPT family oligopeptide transporter
MINDSRGHLMSDKKYTPFVPANVQMSEFTVRAVAIGLIMSVVLGAANAYLGLKAGVTIAATYPAAVIGMAVLRLFRASVLEENIARTAGSIGESIAAGAIFTLPAFIISHSWESFDFEHAYWKSTALMLTGGILGVLFVSLVRRVMVEDPELPFPESVAAAEIHKAGQRGGEAAKFLFINMGVGAFIYLMGAFQLFATDKKFFLSMGNLGSSAVNLNTRGAITPFAVQVGGTTAISAPSVSPAYLGVGYVIGPRLAALNFSGGVIAWGLMVPLLTYFLGPQLKDHLPPGATEKTWDLLAFAVWFSIVRPIAVGGMLVGAAYTLFRMRKNLSAGLGRAFKELGSKVKLEDMPRHERYMSSKVVFGLIGLVFVVMVVLYSYLAGGPLAGGVAALVMLVAGFFFATVSGSLVGMIGSSNNPISGLTISTVLIAALLMVSLGVTGANGVLAVLGVAAVVCVSSAVAGELLQDFKVGYILGGTPRTIQITELIAVVVSSLVMYFPLLVLHAGNIKAGGIGFGDDKLAAPQAGLMATLSKGIVEGNMPWPLVGMGIMMGIGMIMLQVKSPMLVSVGMYLPLATTFSIFVGGIIRWMTDTLADRKGYNDAQKARCENVGILAASGLIAGEALMGLVDATFKFFEWPMPEIFKDPSYGFGFIVLVLLAIQMVRTPLANAGNPEDPAPPVAIM